MKKIYFLFTLLIATASFAQSPIITAIVDGDCSGGNPKLLEIYADGVVDFNLYSLQNQTNSNTAWGSTQDLSIFGTVTNAFVYVTTSGSTAAIASEFPSIGSSSLVLVSGTVNLNGDDRIRIIETATTTVIDQYGVDSIDGTGETWEYADSYAKRLNGTGPDAGFTEANWSIPGVGTINTLGTCQGGAETFETLLGGIGTYSATASTTPSITISGSTASMDYFEANGPSSEESFNISGLNLTQDVTVTAPTSFEVSTVTGGPFGPTATLAQTAGSASGTIYVRLAAGLTVNTYTGDAAASSMGATDTTTPLTGTVSPSTPQFSVFSPSNIALNYALSAGPSNEESISVEGLFLTNDITVTAPANFEVSLTSGGTFTTSVTVSQVSGTVANTDVFVRLTSGLAVGLYIGDITVASAPAGSLSVALNGNVFGAATNTLVLVGAYDGPLSGGVPKGIELVALADIPDLSVFGISSITNGAGSSAGIVEYNFPADAVSAGDRIFLATESTGFTTFFGFAPTYTDNVVGINGDDAIELYEGATIIDTFGDVNIDGTSQAWDYVDGWAYRVSNTGPDGTFVIGNWTFSGADAFDGQSDNATAVTPYPIDVYTNDVLSTEDFTTTNFSIYPNPTNTGFVNITTTSNETINVTVFDILGKQVISQTINNNRLNVSNLNTGVYILKLNQNGATTTKKLVIK
ncbi:MAG: T9SS type A sorting domain-containing protein [Lacinutrix sp.]|uniref:T9SS type A sorting domain-containing protein n=1 Tax=Lacinutrix sp. TaxID=1937692 RepID=UPI003098ED96